MASGGLKKPPANLEARRNLIAPGSLSTMFWILADIFHPSAGTVFSIEEFFNQPRDLSPVSGSQVRNVNDCVYINSCLKVKPQRWPSLEPTYTAPFTAAVLSGMRCGKIFALRGRYLDFGAGAVAVAKAVY